MPPPMSAATAAFTAAIQCLAFLDHDEAEVISTIDLNCPEVLRAQTCIRIQLLELKGKDASEAFCYCRSLLVSCWEVSLLCSEPMTKINGKLKKVKQRMKRE